MPDADTLKLFIDNDSQLYHGQRKSIEDNLLRKKNAGTFNLEKSKKLWEKLAEAGAKKYSKENQGPLGPIAWYQLFGPGERRAAAAAMAREFEAEWELGNYADRQAKLRTKAQRAEYRTPMSGDTTAMKGVLRDTGLAKQVSLRGMRALSGPLTVEAQTEDDIYFRDSENELYFFRHGGSEAQKSGFAKIARMGTKTVRGPSHEAMRGAPGWKKNIESAKKTSAAVSRHKKRAKKASKRKTTKKRAKKTTKRKMPPKRTAVKTIAGTMETTPTGKRPASSHTQVRKVGKEYHLMVGGRTGAIFDRKSEAEDIADVLNEMTLAQAKKEVGL